MRSVMASYMSSMRRIDKGYPSPGRLSVGKYVWAMFDHSHLKEKMLDNRLVQGLPILILANKQDVTVGNFELLEPL